MVLTESKEIITYELKKPLHVSLKERIEQESKIEGNQIPITGKEIDLIEKKRALKRWKKSMGYYSLNPKKFEFK